MPPPRKRVFSTAAMTAPTAEDAIGAGRPPAVSFAEPAAPIPTAAAEPVRIAERTIASEPAPASTVGKPIRVTVQVEYDEHRQLRRLCDRYADEIGVAQVAGAEVFRALLQLALDDEVVARKLGKLLAKTGGSRRRT